MRPLCSIAPVVLSFATASFASAQVELFEVHGDSPNDLFGNSVAAAGDVNGDGFADVIVGAPWDGNNGAKSGSARVLSGKNGATLWAWNGDSAGDEFGIAVAGAGDVDQDGFADLVVGAHLDDVAGADTGTGFVFSGKTGALLFSAHGAQPDDSLGAAVAGAGDLDHDGFADVVIASHHYNANGPHSGAVFVYSGKTWSLLLSAYGNSADDDFGHAVSLAGDVDHDGFDDLLVGAHGYSANGPHAGGAFVVSGKTGAKLLTFAGDSPGDDMGRAVAAGGDVNLDGFPDLFVGMPGDDNHGLESGSARLFSGKTGSILFQFDGDSTGDGLGMAVLGDFDADGDGVPDPVTAAPGDDDTGLNTGSVKIHAGANGALLYSLNGDSPGLRIWRSLAVIDANGDGAKDLLVGNPYDDSSGVDSGEVALYSGNQLAWSDLGHSLAGGGGAPQLAGSGYLTAGTPIALVLSHAAANAPVGIVVGFSALNAPLYGGLLVPSPNIVLVGVTTNPSGSLALNAIWPAGVPSGTTVLFQDWLIDSSGLLGFTASNALRAVTH